MLFGGFFFIAILFGSMLTTGQWEAVVIFCYCSKPCGRKGTGGCSVVTLFRPVQQLGLWEITVVVVLFVPMLKIGGWG